jgi:hypothetical protein
MIEKNIIDKMVDFLREKYQDELENIIGSEDICRQYLSYHFLNGTLVWVNNKEEKITGILISYPCNQEEVEHRDRFDWELPQGENCIFVAEVVAEDEKSRNLLAHAFLQRYPEVKKTYANRHGRLVEIKAHHISKTFTKDIYG